MKIAQHRPGNMTQPARDLMALDGRADGLSDDQPHSRAVVFVVASAHMHDHIGLGCTHATLDGRVKLR